MYKAEFLLDNGAAVDKEVWVGSGSVGVYDRSRRVAGEDGTPRSSSSGRSRPHETIAEAWRQSQFDSESKQYLSAMAISLQTG